VALGLTYAQSIEDKDGEVLAHRTRTYELGLEGINTSFDFVREANTRMWQKNKLLEEDLAEKERKEDELHKEMLEIKSQLHMLKRKLFRSEVGPTDRWILYAGDLADLLAC
jgi:hypothetical protein